MNNYFKVLNPKKKIEKIENPYNEEQRNNFDFMYDEIQEKGYIKYQYASSLLKKKYQFVFCAVYACLSEVNNMEDKFLARRVLKSFLEYVSRESGYELSWNIENGIFKANIPDKSKTINQAIGTASIVVDRAKTKALRSFKLKDNEEIDRAA
jgi:hypothetical protein